MLGLLWWAWAGYSWLTSVLDPDEDAVRAVIFASMGALLIASICIPDAFGDLGLEVALAYGFVRYAHIGLFIIASRDEPELRRSVLGLVVGCTICIGLMVGGTFLEPGGQAALWATALALDVLRRSSSAPGAGSSSRPTSPSATA